MRTWTLRFSSAMSRPSNVHIKGPGVLSEGRTDGFAVGVIEREPVLDLLESQLEFLDAVTQWMGVDPDEIHERKGDLERLLRDGARLQPEREDPNA